MSKLRPECRITKTSSTLPDDTAKEVSEESQQLIPLDPERIISALMSVDVSPLAREHASELFDAWVSEFYERDQRVRTLAVERGFHVWVDELTLLVGVMDRVGVD